MMEGFFTHYRIRLGAVYRSRWALFWTFVSGVILLAQAYDWVNHRMDKTTEALVDPRAFFTAFAFYILPTWSCSWARGRPATGAIADSFSKHVHPSLPIGPKARAIAEAMVVFTIWFAAALFCMAFVLLAEKGAGTQQISMIAAVLVFSFPALLMWTAPVASSKERFNRPWILVFFIFFVVYVLGHVPRPPEIAVSGLAFSVLVLTLSGVRFSLPHFLLKKSHYRGSVSRKYTRSASLQFVRDIWAVSLKVHGPTIAVYIAIMAGVLVLDSLGQLSDNVVFIAGVVFTINGILVVAQRPMGRQLVPIFMGRGKVDDFHRILSSLPVKRTTVLRGVYVYSLVVVGVFIAMAIGLVLFYSIINHGRMGLVSGEGTDFSWCFAVIVVVLTCVPGAVLAGAAGDRESSVVAMGTVFFGIPIFAILAGFVCALVNNHWPAYAAAVFLVWWGGRAPLEHLFDD
jgi:hypothetical protein